ncbi:MAG TPA: AtzG-like protein, partial [Hyphomicrobiaceae bacterium]|nr:AtzG-like protein [Hyphomicrobiaceae bacterium]
MKDDQLDALIDASAAALALPIEPEWKPAIRANLAVTLRLAAMVAELP